MQETYELVVTGLAEGKLPSVERRCKVGEKDNVFYVRQIPDASFLEVVIDTINVVGGYFPGFYFNGAVKNLKGGYVGKTTLDSPDDVSALKKDIVLYKRMKLIRGDQEPTDGLGIGEAAVFKGSDLLFNINIPHASTENKESILLEITDVYEILNHNAKAGFAAPNYVCCKATTKHQITDVLDGLNEKLIKIMKDAGYNKYVFSSKQV